MKAIKHAAGGLVVFFLKKSKTITKCRNFKHSKGERKKEFFFKGELQHLPCSSRVIFALK